MEGKNMDEKQAFRKLKEYVSKGFEWRGIVEGSLHDDELSDLEKQLERVGFVDYFYNWSHNAEMHGPLWQYTVNENGMKFYNKMSEAVK
jgi:hypothetical protein